MRATRKEGEEEWKITSKYKGTMLVAVSQNPVNEIFLIAFAIVDRETKESWGWLLNCLLCYVANRIGLCLISDKHARLTPVNPTSLYKGNHTHVVRLNERTCTCNKLEQWKMPCSHVIAICSYHNLDPLQYFSDYWKLQSNIDMYSTLAFQPVHDERYWPEYFGDKIVPDKDRLRGKGRPRVNRIRNEMDEFV
ncbi:hypothetical protein Vadar_013108 [Vaccinium darrowii]|uniref:Uncharacterized protein n=1 Tax=Vaccinium darrowii TaxID=229202 RepID=A0ACB7YLU2_9ERIC|nr:hypothetical protein Vadar_013108 [Vaccinium darrowii]